jgi:hypothetical protein
MVIATTAVSGSVLLVGAPAAGAETGSIADASASASEGPRHCRPEHRGPRWRWHDARRGDHWDHAVWSWDRSDHRWETHWQHLRWDDRYCAGRGNGRDDRRWEPGDER